MLRSGDLTDDDEFERERGRLRPESVGKEGEASGRLCGASGEKDTRWRGLGGVRCGERATELLRHREENDNGDRWAWPGKG